MNTLPLYPVTTVGSWPRPEGLVRALRERRRGTLTRAAFDRVADAAVLDAVRAQENAGVDIVTDGEQRRDNFYSFVAEKLDGVRLMTLAEMLEVVEDKEGFRRILDTLDVPAYAISNPTCTGRLARREPLAVEEAAALRRITERAIKVALPGPYLLTRAMWVKEVTRAVYPRKEDLAEDVVAILRDEALALAALGVDFLQFDEPVLTELVFTHGRTRTFMCAALAAHDDPAAELAFATSLINRVVAGLSGIRTGLHVCRGNWSTREETLLAGSYAPLLATLARMNVDQLVLEYATPRAGDFVPIAGKEIGLGVVNPRIAEIESDQDIVARVRMAERHMPAERIFLNPDCGFGTFASRPMNTPAIAAAKLASIARAAAMLRAERAPAGNIAARTPTENTEERSRGA
jgi:5-methyltetrahydropteroyltriglutamate--homocysteine methyltransferase